MAKGSTSRSQNYGTRVPLVLASSSKPKQLPVEPALDTLGVQRAQVVKAVEALVANAHKKGKAKEVLIDNVERLELVVTLKRVPARERTNPYRLKVPHAVVDARESQVALLVKDPQRQYKDLLEAKNVGFISKVIGVTKLKGKYKPFEARRQLLREYDMFLADDNIIPLLPKLLGRNWIEAKKQPIPVALSRIDLKAELERAISATYLYIGRGTCISVKVGTVDMHTPEQLVENVLAVIPQLAVRLPQGGWGNVQGLALKTSTSVSLPIWACALDGDDSQETSRFFKPERTIEPPHVSKKSARLDWAAARKELLSDEEDESLKRKADEAVEEPEPKRQKKERKPRAAKKARV